MLGQTRMLTKMNAQLRTMNQNHTNLQKAQVKRVKIEKESNKTQEKAIEIAKNRGDAVSKLTKKLEKEGRAVDLFRKSTYDEFKTVTGQGNFVSFLEYADLLLSSSSQNLKVFGVEVATARKIFYGFLPPGTFRLFNQVSTGIRFISQSFRVLGDSGKEANNIVSTLFKGFGKASGLGEIMKAQATIKQLEKGIQTTGKKSLYGEITKKEARRRTTSMQKGIDRLRPKAATDRKAFTRLALLGDMFEQGGSLSLKKGDRVNRAKSNKERFEKIMRTLKVVASALLSIKVKGLKLFLKLGAMSLRFFLLFMLYASLAFIILKPLLPMLREAFSTVMGLIGISLGLLLDGLGTIFEGVFMVFDAIFGGGSASDLLMGFWTIAFGALKVLAGVGLALFGTGFALLGGFAKGLLSSLKGWFFNLISGSKDSVKALTQIAIGIGLLIALRKGFPLLLATAIATAVYAAIQGLVGFKADGGKITTPMTVVGERGPEILVGKQGSNVISNANSKKALGGTVNNFNITINARDTSDAELRRIADKIGRMVNSKVTRSVSTTTTF